MAKQFRIKHGLVIDGGGADITGSLNVSGSATFEDDILVNDVTVGRGEGDVGTNTAVGKEALSSNVTGEHNTAVGETALRANTSGNSNTAVGRRALLVNTTGKRNTAVGMGALCSNTSGYRNVAMGVCALRSNTTGGCNVAVGDNALLGNTAGLRNTALGTQALSNNTTGGNNTASGFGALQSNTTGGNNAAFGYKSLNANTTGARNTAVGYKALNSNTTGKYNTAVGASALFTNTTGIHHVAIGDRAMITQNGGIQNTAVGVRALNKSTSSSNNTALGFKSLYKTSTGGKNVAVGVCALLCNVTGEANTAVGYNTLKYNTSSKNVAIGRNAMFCNTTGNTNTAVGYSTLRNNTTGVTNTAIGGCALFSNTEGDRNVAVGNDSLCANTTGDNNTALGTQSLKENTSGFGNVAIGYRSLRNNTTGKYNVAVGCLALCSNTTGHSNIAIGRFAMTSGDGGVSSVAVGTLAGQCTDVTITAVGNSSMRFNTTGINNSAFGNTTLYCNTTGTNNTALGHESLRFNTIGCSNTAVGSCALRENTTGANNVGVGYCALKSNSTGGCNTAVGSCTLRANTIGKLNTAVGRFALRDNTDGDCNTAIGSGALRYSTGDRNTAVGYDSMRCNTTGASNTAVGVQSLRCNTSGRQNVAVGFRSMCSSTTSIFNTAVGYEAGCSITSARRNTAIGWKSLRSVTSGGCNTALGAEALLANTAGGNTAVGALALCANTTGANNTALGTCALKDSTTGGQNTALGTNALKANTLGCRNTAVGQDALTANTTGIRNVALGTQALWVSNGSSNVGVGYRTFRNLGVGSLNTGIGNLAGACLVTGSYNTIIGAADADGFDGQNNNIFISDGQGNIRIFATGSNGNVGIGTTSPSKKLEVSGSVKIDKGHLLIDGETHSRIYLQNPGGSGDSFIAWYDSNAAYDWYLGQTSENGGINLYNYTQGGHHVQFNNNGETYFNLENVGIGTSNPAEKLTVEGNVSASGDLTLNGNIYKAIESSYLGLYGGSDSTDNDGFIKIHGNANYWGRVQTNIGYSSASSKAYWTLSNSTELMTLTGAGRLGIGTSSPSASLSIGDGLTGNVNVHLNKKDNNAAGYYIANEGNASGRTVFVRQSAGEDAEIGTNQNNDLSLITNDTTRLFIDGPTGNVGIGNTNPVDMLHVSGGDVMVYNNSIGQYQWRYDANQPVWSVGGGNYFTIRKSSTRLVTLNSSGNFGIGNNSPVEKLTVEGNISASGDLYIDGTASIDGNLTVGGIVTAQEFHTEFVSASIVYSSGSTKFGDTLDDNHDFTGSLNVSGSVEVNIGGANSRKLYLKSTGGYPQIDADGTLYLGGNQASDVQVLDSLLPSANNSKSLGTSTRRWSNIYGAELDISGSGRFTNDLTVTGSLRITDGVNDDELRIYQDGNGSFRFNSTAVGAFLDIGSSNVFDVLGQQLKAATRGGYFDATAFAQHPLQVGPSGLYVQSGSYNVGIGTTSPQYPLHIMGGSNHLLAVRDTNTEVRVGIGTTNPGYAIHIGDYSNGIVQGMDSLRFGGGAPRISSGGNRIYFNTERGYYFYPTGSNPGYDNHGVEFRHLRDSAANTNDNILLVEQSDGTDVFNVKSSGRVGIGTTSPNYDLEVSGSIGVKNDLYIAHDNGSNPTDAGSIYFRESGDTWGTDFYGFRVNQQGSSNYLNFQSANLTTVQDILTLTRDTARVGIGTSSPTEKLHVSGNILLKTPGALSPELQFNNANVGAYRNNDRLVVAGYSGISFKSSNAAMSAQTERMRITSDGDVGIGTLYPSTKLHVSDATAPSFRLSRTGTGQIWEQGIDSSGRFQLKEAASEGGTQYTRLQVDDTGEVQFGAYGQGNITGTAAYTLAVDSSGNIIEIDNSGVDLGSNTDVDTGTEVVDTFTSGSGASAFTNYVVNDGTNYRAGQLMSVWNASGDIEYTDVSTNSIGDTSEVLIFASINGADVEVKATVPTDNWTVKVSSTIL